jgi:flagellar hook-associated protein FlgK
MVDSVTGAGLLAVQRGQETAATASNRIARAGTTDRDGDGDNDLTRGAVELMESEHLVKAGAKVIKTADQMLGSLLDEKA